ncbi:cell wall hydrolase [Alkaliphilus serpentinus]|uniref:cell wall hydrolase n=1 Tax=Alkaliphilus serpentinus TaxID=1482731 RepID=UPI001A9C0974|nr:cell wall hydrolase [Alkaliphilus serpentinus]
MNKYLKGTNKYIIYAIVTVFLVSLSSYALMVGTTIHSQNYEDTLKEDLIIEEKDHSQGSNSSDNNEDREVDVKEPNTYPPFTQEEDKKDELVEESKDEKVIEPEKKEIKPENKELEPITGSEYTVKANDTLYFIAIRSGLSIETLKQYNSLYNDSIKVGQVLALTDQRQPSRGGNRDSEDLYWLSRIIHAEAQGEPYIGKVAVGNVVLNRVKSSIFPNTIKGVVFDKQHGYTQFSPVIDGTIYNNPSQESIEAAKAALKGERPVGDALYFLNPTKSTNFWILENRKYSMTIGDHDFYH